jgi:hypothetical protein
VSIQPTILYGNSSIKLDRWTNERMIFFFSKTV